MRSLPYQSVWAEHVPWLPTRLTSGGLAWIIPIMRRRMNGRWEYRRMTDAEFEEYISVTQ